VPVSEPSDDLFDGQDPSDEDDQVEAPSLARPQRRLVVGLGVALAGLVFIGIAAAALIAVLVFRVRDRADPNHSIRHKYQARYASCVTSGGSAAKDSCSAAVLKACEDDSWWTSPKYRGQRDTVCLAVIPASKG
jgi:hypothetical protein